MSDNLTPTAQAILDHLHDQSPTTAADLRERTGRSRSAIDKALAELAKTGLAAKAPDTGDGPTLWTLADPGTASGPPADAAPPSEPPHAEGADVIPSADPGQDDSTACDGPDGSQPTGRDTGPADSTDPADSTAETGDGYPPDPVTGQATEPMEEVKVCRGCGEQMPKTCPTCWQKTTAYCGTCRKTQPATRRRAPGDTQILANGLPKLRPGELERLVLDVIRAQPLPDHLGITGWTAGRVAIFLPGRSTGAIGNALDKLAATRQAALLGHDPKRYGSIPTEELAADQPDTPGDADQQR